MLEKIPDFSQTPSKLPAPARVADLGTLSIYPSHFLYSMQLAVYALLLLLSLLALLPFLLAAWYWLGIWLIFAWALALAAKRAQRTKNAPPKHLYIGQQQWRLSTSAGEFAVKPDGELLLWPKLIVIPLRELLSGKVHYLVALPDSLDKADWRRLSAWLNLCFARL